MGGERASKTRQREAGKICCKCGILLDWPPPFGHKPGYRTGERFCDDCAPRILVHVIHSGGHPFSVQFTGGPWLLFETKPEVRAVLTWGGVDLAVFDETFEGKSHGSFETSLDERKRYLLQWRRQGWPWNGHELLLMWRAGKYPPARLTPAQERIFLANRRRDESRRRS